MLSNGILSRLPEDRTMNIKKRDFLHTLVLTATLIFPLSTVQAAAGGNGGGGNGKITLTDLGCAANEVARVNASNEWECSTSLTEAETDTAAAHTAATSAQTAAAAAQSTANSAQSTADSANSLATSTATDVNQLTGEIEQITTKADHAESVAIDAVYTAEVALEISVNTKLTAGQALETAEHALFYANGAQQGVTTNYDMLVNNIEPRISALETSMDGMIFEAFVGFDTCFDLDSGEVRETSLGVCAPEGDIIFAFDSFKTSPTLFHWNGEAALMPGAPFHAVTVSILEPTIQYSSISGQFPGQNIDTSFTTTDTAIVRTLDGSIYKVGFSICKTQLSGNYPGCVAVASGSAVGVHFQYQLLQENN